MRGGKWPLVTRMLGLGRLAPSPPLFFAEQLRRACAAVRPRREAAHKAHEYRPRSGSIYFLCNLGLNSRFLELAGAENRPLLSKILENSSPRLERIRMSLFCRRFT
jgi:hypothetical protein